MSIRDDHERALFDKAMRQAPRILTIALTTFADELACSADRSVVTIAGHRARCARGHRWVRVDGAWRSVGRD